MSKKITTLSALATLSISTLSAVVPTFADTTEYYYTPELVPIHAEYAEAMAECGTYIKKDNTYKNCYNTVTDSFRERYGGLFESMYQLDFNGRMIVTGLNPTAGTVRFYIDETKAFKNYPFTFENLVIFWADDTAEVSPVWNETAGWEFVDNYLATGEVPQGYHILYSGERGDADWAPNTEMRATFGEDTTVDGLVNHLQHKFVHVYGYDTEGVRHLENNYLYSCLNNNLYDGGECRLQYTYENGTATPVYINADPADEDKIIVELKKALKAKAEAESRLVEAEERARLAEENYWAILERASVAESNVSELQSVIAEAEENLARAESALREAESAVQTARESANSATARAEAAEGRASEAENRAEAAEGRASEAETRASEAEARASEANQRANDAENRADQAEAEASAIMEASAREVAEAKEMVKNAQNALTEAKKSEKLALEARDKANELAKKASEEVEEAKNAVEEARKISEEAKKTANEAITQVELLKNNPSTVTIYKTIERIVADTSKNLEDLQKIESENISSSSANANSENSSADYVELPVLGEEEHNFPWWIIVFAFSGIALLLWWLIPTRKKSE